MSFTAKSITATTEINQVKIMSTLKRYTPNNRKATGINYSSTLSIPCEQKHVQVHFCICAHAHTSKLMCMSWLIITFLNMGKNYITYCLQHTKLTGTQIIQYTSV